MKRLVGTAVLPLALCCGAADWDGAYIAGDTAEGKLFYAAGETMTFRLRVGGIAALPEGDWQLKWRRTGDDGAVASGTAPVSLSAPCEITTSLNRPGFVRLEASVVGAPASVKFAGGAGADLDGIVADRGEPADFEGFWRSQLAALGKVEANPQLVELASPKSGVRLYEFRLGCVGDRPATGYLTVPEAVGTYPARLLFYGYNQSWTADVLKPPKSNDVRADEIQLRVNAHGLALGRDDAYYAAAKAAVSWGSNAHGWNPDENETPETCYFLNMVLRDVRAAQYAQTLAKWNGRDLVVDGGSQGAFQSVLVASLCPQVSSVQVYINWLCDMRGKAFGDRLASEFQPEYRPGLDYFDEVFHARRISSSCYVNVTRAGLGDYISPPSGIACFYNALRCRKRIVFLQNAEHSWTTSAPGNPSAVYTSEKRAEPGPDVDWRDLEISAGEARAGYNFTNELVCVTIAKTGAYGNGGAKLRLVVKDSSGAAVATVVRPVEGVGDCVFDTAASVGLPGLTPGGAYSYEVTLVNGEGANLRRGTVAEGSFKMGRTTVACYARAAENETFGGSWAENPEIRDGAYRIAPGSSGSMFALAESRLGVLRLSSVVRIDGGYSTNDLESVARTLDAEAARSALVLVEGQVSHWARPVRTDDGIRFERLYGAENPEDGATYEIVIETDTAAAEPVVSYLVGPVGGEKVRLADATGRERFALAGGATGVGGVRYCGGLALASLDGEREDDAPYSVEGSELRLNTNVWLDPSVLPPGAYALTDSGFRFRWSDGAQCLAYDAAQDRFVVSATSPANGLSGFESYVLGLDAADATSAPVLDLSLSPSAVELTLRQKNGEGLRPRTVSGLAVGYRLEHAANVRFAEAQTSAAQTTPTFFVPHRDGAQFYRAKVLIRDEWE